MGRETLRESAEPSAKSVAHPDPEEAVAFLKAVASFTQVTLHRSSAGRGGKTVTLVAIKPRQSPAALEALSKALRKGLGCGSRVEEDRIALQGDIPDRAREWFAQKGARKIVRGN